MSSPPHETLGHTIRLGNHLWAHCGDCGKLVKLTGWLRGLHLCLTDEERALQHLIDRQRQATAHQSPSEFLRRLMQP